MQTLKGLLKSKVFWFNAASICLELTNAVLPLIPPGSTLIAVNLINIVLRTLTTKSLQDK